MINKIVIYLRNKDAECWNFNTNQLDTLKKEFSDKNIVNCINQESFLNELKDADIAVIWIFKDEWLDIAENLKIIISPAAGKDFFELNTDRNILRENSSFHGKIMAETVLAMMLSHNRGIIKSMQLQTSSQWPRKELSSFMRTLKNSTACIIGFGNIGKEIARLLKPFSIRIIGIKKNPAEKAAFMDADDIIDTIENINKYLPEADHLILCIPRNKSTDNLINMDRINLLKKSAVIYNVGRGNAIKEDDLALALEKNQIAAAYLDVFKEEPLPMNSKLRKLENCIVMPHSSAISPEYLDLFVEEFIEKIKKWDRIY